MLAAMLAPSGPPRLEPDLSGEWTLASAMTNLARDGGSGEQPSKTFVADGWAFNCGRECRIVQKDSTLSVQHAQLAIGGGPPAPAVTIVVDSKPHAVIDSVNAGNTIETTGQWDGGKLSLVSMLLGRGLSQTVSLEQSQLVVVQVYPTSSAKLTLRYVKK